LQNNIAFILNKKTKTTHKKQPMKKQLLLSTALLVSVMGFSQKSAKKAANPGVLNCGANIAVETTPATNGILVGKKNTNSTSGSCINTKAITTSYNCLGTGGGYNTSTQNCLTYNSDLNALVWIQRGSKTWPLCTTSGFIQATIINATTLATDSFIVYADSNISHHARYPSGTIINPIGNKDYHKAYAVGIGQVISDLNIWSGVAYCAKPLWSKSAINHTKPTGDSLFSNTFTQGSVFGDCSTGGGYTAAPANDVQALPDGKTVVSIGAIRDTKFGNAAGTTQKGLFAKGVSDNTGKVNWTVDSTSLIPDSKVGTLGHLLSIPRIAFGPDGLHGYAVFTGVLATAYNNPSDSAMTPIVFKTNDGGSTWNQVLQGYDWMANHPEVAQNVGQTNFIGSKGGNYNFDYKHGVDLTVDANNVLHYVSTVTQPYDINGTDSIAAYGYVYDYDYINHHPIIWDFMTDGTCWKTMIVDSIISALCGTNTAIDSTASHSAMGGASILPVGAHITVSRSIDGTKVFYGWADSDPSVTGAPYNTSPDILMKAYDLSTVMISATKNVTNGIGTCFYPFLSDLSYFDAIQSAWVVPAVYTSSGATPITSTPQITYNASAQADYYYTNCGTFAATDFTTQAPIINGTFNACNVGIKTNPSFAGSISNYPNPFNNTTTIAVILSENKAVDVKIYNAIGNLVFSKKVNGNVGENTVTFDGGQLSSGIYYYTVTAGNQQATKKMIIQK
jgi:hypothetical protein